jgi:hypothetical protein
MVFRKFHVDTTTCSLFNHFQTPIHVESRRGTQECCLAQRLGNDRNENQPGGVGRATSVGMTTICPVRPWRRAFRELRHLPVSVLGPVECRALARLVSVRFVSNDTDICFYLSR